MKPTEAVVEEKHEEQPEPDPGGVVWQPDGEIDMDLLPPISASLGAMCSLSGKLDALQDTELKDEIRKLGSRLLKLDKAQDPPLTAKIWMKEVRELSYDMVNCVDADAEWIDKMSGFKARVKESNGRYDRYKLESVPSRTDVLPIPTVVVGRKPDLVVGLHAKGGAFETLRNTLTDGDEQLKVLSVVGAGGIGKTTLAKQLWREDKLQVFDCRAFVRTAKKPDMRRILRSILAQVRPHQPPDASEVHDLIHDLTEHLKDKRYFIIIDDLWDTSVWDVAARALPKGNHGSRIITTTEIEDVALACCSYQSRYMLKMEPLSDSHSKELFISAVFSSGEQHSRQVDEVSDEIIRICAGLPQAIISISSVLASHGEANTVENWEQIQNRLPTNTTSDGILKEVLIFCYNSLPSCVQTCLLYLNIYPENYVIMKEDITKQWVAEGFIHAPTEKEKMEVAGSYFDMLVNMGMIQHIDVDYGNEVLYYGVHHMVHDIITSKSIEENFVTVIDYSRRTVRFSNKVSRLSLQFGGATYATTPARIGLSQVRSLAYTGLMSCLPSISEFKLLRLLILHIWADQPSTSVDLKCISGLLLLRYLQATCNSTVHLPEQMQRLKHLETLEINARVAAIPSDIVHLRSLLHLRLGGGTELPDVTGILTNVTLNPPSAATLLDDSSSSPDSLNTMELLPPICRIPKWIGQLTDLCILKVVVRELLRDDISNLQRLPALTVLSLYVQQRTTELISFGAGAFSALEYFEFRCGELRLMFQEGAMPNLQRIKLGFNARRGEQYEHLLSGIENLSNVQEISGIIGVAGGADEHDFQAAESAFTEAVRKLSSKVSVKRADMVAEECGPAEKQHVIRGKDASSSVKSEQPAILKQESEEVIKQNAGGSLLSGFENLSNVEEISGMTGVATGAEELDIQAAESAFMKSISKHPNKVSVKRADMVEEECGPAEKQHVIRERDASSSVKSEQPVIPKQESSGNYQFIQRRRNSKETAKVVQGLSGNRELRGGAVGENEEEERRNSLGKGNSSMNFDLNLIRSITNNFSDAQKVGRGMYGDVYRAVHNREEIAVKKLHPFQGLDDMQFDDEVRNLTKVCHKNVVRLIGYCYEVQHKCVEYNGVLVFAKKIERVICFEYMQGESLDKHIADEPCGLGWSTCYGIIKGTCEGLNHLHNAHGKPIFHLDLKPGNILLDKSMMPKISDLGLSRLVALTEAHETEVKERNGYMPPEYINSGNISKKFDVFSLGVIIIRTMAGNKGYFRCSEMPPKQFIDLVSEDWKKRLQAMPGDSSQEMDILQVCTCIGIALRCVDANPKNRPTIQDIVHELEELEYGTMKIMSVPSAQSKDLIVQEEERRINLARGKSSMDFKLHVIEAITNNFSDDLKLGSGAYGDVYRAVHNGEEIAVKKLHPFQGLDDKQFHNEVRNLIKVHHKNVVRLIGYCYESRHKYIEHNKNLVFMKTMERVICFEYMQGGSLDKHITDEPCGLCWSTCYDIIKGTCEGLNHLHSVQEKPIYHLELKPGNILLDKSMMPKIGDLGLSKLVASTETHRTEMLKGTSGYMPPEYIDNGYISKKFDVFSLGVIILRMMAGNKGYFSCSRMPSEQFIDLVSENWKERLQAASKDLSYEMDILRVRKCVEIALRCVETDRKKRPTVQGIIRELEELETGINSSKKMKKLLLRK